MGFIFLVLLVGALIAAIWGRSSAQGFVAIVLGGGAILTGLAVIVLAIFLFTTQPTNMSRAHGAWDTASASTTGVTNYNMGVPAASYTPPATPASTVMPIVGIQAQMMTASQDASVGLVAGYGVSVAHIIPGSPAEQAHVQAGDFITKVNGSWITGPSDIQNAVRAYPAGTYHSLELLRDNHIYDIKVESQNYTVPAGS